MIILFIEENIEPIKHINKIRDNNMNSKKLLTKSKNNQRIKQ